MPPRALLVAAVLAGCRTPHAPELLDVPPLPCTHFDPPTEPSDRALPALLSRTGCVDPLSPAETIDAALPYSVNAAFWSDNADKGRHVVLPLDGTIDIQSDGDLLFPVGTTLIKHLFLEERQLETRLLIHHQDGTWAGYTYAWEADGTDAVLLLEGWERTVDGQLWDYPSPEDCASCHTDAAGYALGPELRQLNRDHTYDELTANQIDVWQDEGYFSDDPGDPAALPALVDPFDPEADLDDRARSWLHVNCAQCHRPGSPVALSMDLRFDADLTETVCDVEPAIDGGIEGARRIAPGDPERSLVYLRPQIPEWRMPPVGTNLISEDGVALLEAWITGMDGCMP